jgi:two-component system LytT family sensor kinase
MIIDPSILRRRFLIFSCAIIFFGWSLIQTFILYWYGIQIEAAVVDSLISAATITLACYIVANALHYYQPGKEKVAFILVWIL